MSREINFRGRTLNGGQWVYGSLLQDDYGNCCIVEFVDHHEQWHDVEPNSLGQFTGLYDKNGKEIYEDDIVMWDVDNRLYLVAFWSGMFYASVVKDEDISMIGGFPLHRLTNHVYELCKITGNRYDNPELLKGG